MNLRAWLDLNGMDSAALAEKLGVHSVTISKWSTGRMMPRRDMLRAIEKITAGAVVATDFVDPPNTPSPSPQEAAA